MKLAGAMGFAWPAFAPTPLHKLIPHASAEALQLIGALCSWDPARRPRSLRWIRSAQWPPGR